MRFSEYRSTKLNWGDDRFLAGNMECAETKFGMMMIRADEDGE